MERLQAAIAKARAARELRDASVVPEGEVEGRKPVPAQIPATASDQAGAVGDAPLREGPRPVLVAGDDADEWNTLPEAKISEQVLIDHRILSTVGRSAEAMEFDRLRTRVQQRMQANGWTRMAITSPGPACGKSTIALNLGFGLARQEDARIMLLEMDMRRPSIGRILGLRTETDFSQVLAGKSNASDNLIRARDNLVIGMTQHVANSAELLQSASAATILDEVSSRYQPSMMIFDMPPFRVSDDVLSFAGKVDCVLIVAAAGQTSMEELDECERELAAQTQVLGVVLNKCRYQDQDGQYYYYN